jgi:hypothetical protein
MPDLHEIATKIANGVSCEARDFSLQDRIEVCIQFSVSSHVLTVYESVSDAFLHQTLDAFLAHTNHAGFSHVRQLESIRCEWPGVVAEKP